MSEIVKLRQMRADLITKARTEILDKTEAEDRELTSEEHQEFQRMMDESDRIFNKVKELEIERDRKSRERLSIAENELQSGGSLSNTLIASPNEPSPAVNGSGLSTEHQNRAIVAWCRKQAGLPLDEADRYSCNLYQRFVDRNFTPESRDLRVNLSGNRNWRAMQNAFRGRHQSINVQNALSTGSTAGGAMIPEGFVRSLEIALLAFGGMLQVADVLITDSGNDLPWPTANDTGNTGALLSEATTVGSSTDPTFSAVTFNAYKYSSKLVQVSAEIIQDSAFDLPSILGAMLGERLGRILNNHLTVADGNAKPHGIVTASDQGKAATSATAIDADELIDLQHSVDPAYRPNAAWMMADSTVSVIRKLKDSDGQYLWQPGLKEGVPDMLLGRRVWINQDMADIAASAKVILYGDFSKYKVRLVRGVRNRRLVERYADTDQEGFVSFLRADGDLLDAGTNPVKHLVMAAS